MDRYKHAEVYKISFYQDLKNNPVILWKKFYYVYKIFIVEFKSIWLAFLAY
jgi:hypothetical protein